jgi:hypothetical protein
MKLTFADYLKMPKNELREMNKLICQALEHRGLEIKESLEVGQEVHIDHARLSINKV